MLDKALSMHFSGHLATGCSSPCRKIQLEVLAERALFIMCESTATTGCVHRTWSLRTTLLQLKYEMSVVICPCILKLHLASSIGNSARVDCCLARSWREPGGEAMTVTSCCC